MFYFIGFLLLLDGLLLIFSFVIVIFLILKLGFLGWVFLLLKFLWLLVREICLLNFNLGMGGIMIFFVCIRVIIGVLIGLKFWRGFCSCISIVSVMVLFMNFWVLFDLCLFCFFFWLWFFCWLGIMFL